MSWPIAPFLKVALYLLYVTVRDPLLSFCSVFSGPGPEIENEFVVIRRAAAARTRTYTHSRPMYRIYQKISLLSAARALDVFVRLWTWTWGLTCSGYEQGTFVDRCSHWGEKSPQYSTCTLEVHTWDCAPNVGIGEQQPSLVDSARDD